MHPAATCYVSGDLSATKRRTVRVRRQRWRLRLQDGSDEEDDDDGMRGGFGRVERATVAGFAAVAVAGQQSIATSRWETWHWTFRCWWWCGARDGLG